MVTNAFNLLDILWKKKCTANNNTVLISKEASKI